MRRGRRIYDKVIICDEDVASTTRKNLRLMPEVFCGTYIKSGDPYGTRTRVARMKTWSPRPLDEGVFLSKGARTIADRATPAIQKISKIQFVDFSLI